MSQFFDDDSTPPMHTSTQWKFTAKLGPEQKEMPLIMWAEFRQSHGHEIFVLHCVPDTNVSLENMPQEARFDIIEFLANHNVIEHYPAPEKDKPQDFNEGTDLHFTLSQSYTTQETDHAEIMRKLEQAVIATFDNVEIKKLKQTAAPESSALPLTDIEKRINGIAKNLQENYPTIPSDIIKTLLTRGYNAQPLDARAFATEVKLSRQQFTTIKPDAVERIILFGKTMAQNIAANR